MCFFEYFNKMGILKIDFISYDRIRKSCKKYGKQEIQKGVKSFLFPAFDMPILNFFILLIYKIILK